MALYDERRFLIRRPSASGLRAGALRSLPPVFTQGIHVQSIGDAPDLRNLDEHLYRDFYPRLEASPDVGEGFREARIIRRNFPHGVVRLERVDCSEPDFNSRQAVCGGSQRAHLPPSNSQRM